MERLFSQGEEAKGRLYDVKWEGSKEALYFEE